MECNAEQLFEIYDAENTEELILISSNGYHTQMWYPKTWEEAKIMVDVMIDDNDVEDLVQDTRSLISREIEIFSNRDFPDGFTDTLGQSTISMDDSVFLNKAVNLKPGTILMFMDLSPRGCDRSSAYVLGTSKELAEYLTNDSIDSVEDDTISGENGEYFFLNSTIAKEVWDAHESIYE